MSVRALVPSRRSLAISLLALIPASPLVAAPLQESPPAESSTDAAAQKIDERLLAAYATTTTLTTIEQASEIIRVCESALAESLPETDRRYARQLASWAYAKRADLSIGATVPVAFESSQQSAIDSDLARALEYDPSNWRARLLRGVMHGSAERYDEAIADLDRALKANPKARHAWFDRAEIRSKVGDYVLAIEDYRQALALDPRDAEAYAGRGHAYFALGKHAEALADYQKLVLLTAGDSRALVMRGDLLAAAGQATKAREDYELALARDKESGLPHVRLAWLIATSPEGSQGTIDRALTLAQRGAELRPEAWEAVETLATCLQLADRSDEALAAIEAWGEKHPEAPAERTAALVDRLELQR